MGKIQNENFNYLKNKVIQMAWHSFATQEHRMAAITDMKTLIDKNLASGDLTKTQYDKLVKLVGKI